MVEAFFGFKKTPFSDSSDAKQLFASQAWNQVKARLQFLVDHQGAGLLTGEVGAGKSTAARAFVAGLNPFASTAFSVSTIAIALPASAKVLSWIVTIWRTRPRYTAAMLFSLGFLSLFITGGLTGPVLAQPILDDLAAAIENHKLDDWEDPGLVASALATLMKMSVKIQADKAAQQKLFERICRLDPAQALGDTK